MKCILWFIDSFEEQILKLKSLAGCSCGFLSQTLSQEHRGFLMDQQVDAVPPKYGETALWNHQG